MADKIYTIREGVTVTEEVIANIAALAATDVEGVAYLNGGLTRSNIIKAGAGKVSKAVRVIADAEGALTIQMIIVTDYEHSILTVSRQVQEKVKTTVEDMTDLTVKAVDVKVSTVSMQKNQ